MFYTDLRMCICIYSTHECEPRCHKTAFVESVGYHGMDIARWCSDSILNGDGLHLLIITSSLLSSRVSSCDLDRIQEVAVV